MKQFLACVAVENVAYHFDILYGYTVPEELNGLICEGTRVLVPFGKGKNVKRQGVVFSFEEAESGKSYKSILSVLDDTEIITKEMIDIASFLKERTFCTYFEGIKVQIPSGLNFKTSVKYFALYREPVPMLSDDERQVYEYMLSFDGFLSKKEVYTALGYSADCDIIERLAAKKLLTKDYNAVRNSKDATVRSVRLTYDAEEIYVSNPKLTPKQKSVIGVLNDVGSATVKELCYFTGVTSSVVFNLEKKGIVEIFDVEIFRIPESDITDGKSKEKIILTDKQRSAYDRICSRYSTGGGVSLLYGITGSGKTSVFISLIDRVISDGRQVIVMVPEISLTPQMMALFKGRYGSDVAIFHSALSVGERRDEYKRVKNGMVKIAIGTRSAVFAPFDNLGLIVIDEEQEHTYKSEASPRYHTTDVAKFRAANHKALLLLSSATPSLESYSNALRGSYSLNVLDERYGDAVLPEVEIVDMKLERQRGNMYSVSSRLLELMENNLKNGKQTILLINRRGYNTFAACDSCSTVVTCPYCSISMTYHSANGRLMCHYCGYSMPFTKVCPECGKDNVRYAGFGTQRIEEELSELLPDARVLRMDTDSAGTRLSFEQRLSDFGSGKYDIMLGTQMVAKGLNFENVTLVGVINADQQLNNDDFRSQERTFDLLTQVVGRAGRGKSKGFALIQTAAPQNHVIRMAQRQDYPDFFNTEISIRKAMVYPPYCDICSVMFVSSDEVKSLNCAKAFLEALKKIISEKYNDVKIIVLGPMPPRISKISNKFRYRIIIKCKNNRRFREMMKELIIAFGKNSLYSSVSVVTDINPENLC
ncbi:MAG: primosomal protein N' [Ruminococcaceae bacterium]|nr:primosomal protein N' [Oscillospiraceae bacterium]